MKFFRAALLLFFLLSPSLAFAQDHFKILNWNEDTTLLVRGKASEVRINGKIVNTPKNQVMTSFGLSFARERKIEINHVTCDGVKAQYSFSGNDLRIKFPKPKADGETVLVSFSYLENYSSVNESLRQEVINIPAFAAGANARVAIKFPGYMESATLNPNIYKNGNSFVYSNIVPKSGVEEIIKLTDAESVWNVSVKVRASSNRPLGKFNIGLPYYFQSPRQKVEDYSTFASSTPLSEKTVNNVKNIGFNSNQNEVLIESKARITTGKNVRGKFDNDPKQYLYVSQEERNLLSPLLAQIIQNPDYNLPLHARIGKFVYGFIEYDLGYSNKLLSVKEILQKRRGVCVEYAKLYNSLARLAGIPSFIIEGTACGGYKGECRGHSWNMIYKDGEWIEVDPTWNLMSGIVSSSHIYFNEGGKGEAIIEYFKNNPVKLEMDFEMKRAL
ncbi:MAG: hypothetical protein K0R25_404 [Rickettsiaceae bacterium]|jgi:transglutaminase-like putative cysteine protease|nr:hypothetical protein [Rickettsiaceae bacterium]